MEKLGAILITGGTKGIGLAAAVELVELGFRKFILGYHSSEEAAQKAKQQLEQTAGVSVVLIQGNRSILSRKESLVY